MAGRAEVAALAGKGKQIFMAAVRTPDAGKAVMKISAVKIPADYFPHIRAKKSVPPAELLVINLFKSFKVVFNALLIVRALRVTRMVLMCAEVGCCRCCLCLFHNNRQ